MIEQIKYLFAINDVIVQFVHGQVFLILGVAMALQWRRRSDLELARALPWLAAFGLFEAVATWGNSFIPIQTALLPASVIQTLRFLQVLVYMATFMALLGFGLKLNEPVVSHPVTLSLPLIGFGVLALLLLVLQIFVPGSGMLASNAGRNMAVEAMLRYFIAIPAALLAAYGLRQQAAHLVGPLPAARIIRVLRVAGYGFLLYALVEGLLAPPLPFFPANVLNSQTVYNAIGAPVGILRAIAGGVIAYSFLRALEVFRLEAERVAQALEHEKSLRAERERISRDLHDGTIQSIYAAGLMLDGVRQTLDTAAALPQLPAPEGELLGSARVQLDQVMTALNKTIQGIRGYIYDLRNAAGDEDLARGLVQVVNEFRSRTGLETTWSAEGTPAATFTLSAEQRQHVYQIVREALSNIARHAGATHVSVELRYDGCDKRRDSRGALCLQIRDDGKGIGSTEGKVGQAGQGLRNMRERAQLLGAALDIQGTVGKGTVVTLEISNGKDQTSAGG
jgi:signal transduction histidine kinase